MRRDGNWYEEFTIAARTRSRLSCTAASGRPTTLKAGAAGTTSASTTTGWPWRPFRASVSIRANMTSSSPTRRRRPRPCRSSVPRERRLEVTYLGGRAAASTATMSKRTSLTPVSAHGRAASQSSARRAT